MNLSVIITDSVHPVCFELLNNAGIEANVQLKRSDDELKQLVKDADGWIIRSGTRITSDLVEAAENLKVIGRAGVGVDNVDLKAATRKGILVLNAPEGNTISTAEHACTLMMALSRHVPQADASLKSGKWDRKSFSGSELFEKTLGVVGLGKIGRVVASRMQGFGMTVLGYDPVVSREMAENMGVTLVSLEELYRRSDIITIHTPKNEATRGMLNKNTLAVCRPGVFIVNCARGGIVDEKDLLQALESGHVGGAALDVYSQEPPPPTLESLVRHPRVISTPHIAASTREAQTKVARQVTEQVIRALQGKPVLTPVNALAIRLASQREVQPYLVLAEKLGQIARQLATGRVNGITVRCHGEKLSPYSEVLTVATLKGVLGSWAGETVNLVNALYLSEEMGLHVKEERDTATDSYKNLLTVILETDAGKIEVGGTLFGTDEPRMVRVNEYRLEVRMEGRLLFYRNEDRPGMLASVGQILANAGINIGSLALGRLKEGAQALTAISIDESIPEVVLSQIAGLKGVEDVRFIDLSAP